MGQQALLMCGIYYIDILSIPFALECLRRILTSCRQRTSALEIYYFAGLAGIWFAFKMTNTAFIAPFVLTFIVISHKELNAKRVGISAVLCAVPCSVSLIFAAAELGNPIFPFFNTFFKSPYYLDADFKDMRWGPTSLVETVLWPVYRVFRPEYRQAEISGKYTFLYAIGLFGLCWIVLDFIKCIRTKTSIKKYSLVMSVLYILSELFWSVSIGLVRYFILGDMLLGILAYDFVLNCILKIDLNIVGKLRLKAKSFTKILEMCLAVVVLVVSFMQSALIMNDILKGAEWSWRPFSLETAEEQLPYLFRDKTFFKDDIKTDYFLISHRMYDGLADMANCDAYIFDLSYLDKMPDNKERRHAEDILTAMDGAIRDIRDFYWEDIEEYIDKMNQLGIYIAGAGCVTGQTGYYCVPTLEHINKPNELYLASDASAFESDVDDNILKFMLLRKGITYDQPYTVTVVSGSGEEVFREDFSANNLQPEYSVRIHGGDTYKVLVQGKNEPAADGFYILNPRLVNN